MFHYLGIAVSRAWALWLLIWIGIVVVAFWAAPDWDALAQDREFAFLPEDSPSHQGNELLRKAFPNDLRVSNIVIVASREDQQLTDDDRAFIKNIVRPALLHIAEEKGGLASSWERTNSPTHALAEAPPIVAEIRTLNDEQGGGLLVSTDGQATVVLMDLTTELLDARNYPVVAEVESLLPKWKEQGLVPSGLNLHLMGGAVVGRDIAMGQKQSSSVIEFWTVALVVGMLLLIYQAPFLSLIPLLSVALATQVSLKVLAILANAGFITLFGGVEIYITIILYGSGVDYCLFLIARYREERERGADWDKALELAVCNVGPALLASAFTVIFGIGTMITAHFGKFHTAGIAVTISLVIGLLVVLTFTTSLLRLLGSVAFWPREPHPSADDGSPPVRASRWRRLVGWFSWDSLGKILLRRPALIWTCTVLLMSPLVAIGVVYGDDVDYDFIRQLPHDAPSVVGTRALEAHFPAGAVGMVTVLLDCPECDFRTEDAKPVIELETLTDRLKARHTPLKLADIRSLTAPMGITVAARHAFDIPVDQIPKAKQDAMHYYVSYAGDLAGHVTRLELTMTLNPLSREGIAWLNDMEETIRSELPGILRNAKVYVTGTTADMRDLRKVTCRDQIRIQLLATLSVFVILTILLRRVGVALYLITSVLFSYFATMGMTLAFFWCLNPEGFTGLDWKVPIFLFTILAAIGEDYNIFLMTRIHEEQRQHGKVEGIHVALVSTGRIITSCGIIMAGTFASLLFGTMEDLRHLGFALGFGVLLDTFVVRPILVPTFLIVVERCILFWNKMSALVEKAPELTTTEEHSRDPATK